MKRILSNLSDHDAYFGITATNVSRETRAVSVGHSLYQIVKFILGSPVLHENRAVLLKGTSCSPAEHTKANKPVSANQRLPRLLWPGASTCLVGVSFNKDTILPRFQSLLSVLYIWYLLTTLGGGPYYIFPLKEEEPRHDEGK